MERIHTAIDKIREHKDAAIIGSSVLLNAAIYALSHNPTIDVTAFVATAAFLSSSTDVGEAVAKTAALFLSSHVPDEETQQKVYDATKTIKKKIQFKNDEELPNLNSSRNHYYFVPDMIDQLSSDELLIAIDHDIWYTININDCYHILIAGQTGNGKTTLIRQLLMQMILRGCCCYLIDPMYKEVKGVNDDRKVECWEPLATRMPMNPSGINQTHKTRDELFQRLELKLNERIDQRGGPRVERKWKPIFVFIDEGPNVLKNCSHAEEVIGRIVREGRQLKIFLVLVTQSAQVQSLGLGTDDLSQFCTRFYLGGDDRTRREIMPQLQKEEGQKLKKLQVALTRVDDKTPAVIQLPYLNNEDLYAAFGEEFCLEDFSDWFEELEDEDDDPLGTVSISSNSKFDEKDDIEIETEEKIEILKFEMSDEEMGRIIQAFEDLENEGKKATPHALWKKLEVNWNYQPKIEYVAKLAGYDIIESNAGRKAKANV